MKNGWIFKVGGENRGLLQTGLPRLVLYYSIVCFMLGQLGHITHLDML